MTVTSKGATLYTLGELARLLDVDDKTARRWAAAAKIETIPDDMDRRRRLFTEEHLETLRRLHPTSGNDTRDELAKVSLAELSAQVAALEQSQANMVKSIDGMSNRVADLQSAMLSITTSMATITEAIATIIAQRSIALGEPVGAGRQ